jgi:NADH-quinone oxidoreductase subunit E
MDQSALQIQFPDDTLAVERQPSEIWREFKGRPDDLIPMLQRIQREFGYLPERALLEIAYLTGVPSAKVFGVATFYAQFRLHPVGKHMIRVCRGTACHVRRSGRILNDIETRFQVAPGETTKDRLLTLETVACFGSCALAPVVVVNDSVHGRMNPSKAIAIVEDLQGEIETSSTGESMRKG